MRPGVGPALRQPLAEITHGRSYGAAIWIISGRALACQHTQRHSGFICLPQRFGSQRLAPYLRRIVIPSSPLFSRWIEHALDVAVNALMTPIRANIVGPPSSTTSITGRILWWRLAICLHGL